MVKLNKQIHVVRKIDKNKQYDVNEAFALLKQLPSRKFIESVDIAVNLDIDARRADQNIRSTVILPHGIGRSIRVAVFTHGLNIKTAISAGADMVGMEDLATYFKESKKINFDIVIASPDAMHIVGQLGQILGPRGLMPNPKIGTITSNVVAAVKNAKSGQILYRNDKNGIVHTTIGKISFKIIELKENLEAVLISLKKEKPTQIKNVFFKKISVSTTMGSSINIDQTSLNINLN